MSIPSGELREEIGRLERENEHLRRVDTERQATIALLQEQLQVLQEQIALLKKALFSPRRERYIPSADQKLLFEPQLLAGAEASTPTEQGLGTSRNLPPGARNAASSDRVLCSPNACRSNVLSIRSHPMS